MIKTIVVANYIEIASTALLETVNTVIKKQNKFIDINSLETKKLFMSILNRNIISNKIPGKKLILINTCKCENNWKAGIKRFKSIKNSPNKYQFKHADIKMSMRNLSNLLDKYWLYLKSNEKYVTIEIREGDSIDVIESIKESISEDFLIVNPLKFSMLVDKNILMYYSKNKTSYKIPQFVKEKVWTKLSKNGVI